MKNIHIVFDLDWTLADTQKIHQKIESDFLRSFWVSIDPENIWKIFAGRSPQEWISELLKQENVDFLQKDIDIFVDSKDEKVINLLDNWEIELMNSTKKVLETLSLNWCKIWLSSGACREFIDKFIIYFELQNIIEASTSANEVLNKKPNPDVFEKSFKTLENKYWIPEKKYVVWDWWSDVEGWYKSWAKTIWINQKRIMPKIPDYLDYQVDYLLDVVNVIL